MIEFTSKHAASIDGTLSGFDRLVFRESLRRISYPFGMGGYLWANRIPLKDFGAGPPAWLRMRKGIADLHRRAEVSQKVNNRYLDALASVDDSTRLRELVGLIEKPVTCNGKRMRALHPFEEPDRRLLEVISRDEFAINGLRNRDLLYSTVAPSPEERPPAIQRHQSQAPPTASPPCHSQGSRKSSLSRHARWPPDRNRRDRSFQRHRETAHSKGSLMNSSREHNKLMVSSTEEHG